MFFTWCECESFLELLAVTQECAIDDNERVAIVNMAEQNLAEIGQKSNYLAGNKVVNLNLEQCFCFESCAQTHIGKLKEKGHMENIS